MAEPIDISEVEVIAPNLKRRLSGVTSVIIQIVPEQHRQGTRVATLGPGLPDGLPKIPLSGIPGLMKRPNDKPFRIWHARRNTEMLAGLILKQIFRAPLKLVFTSEAQRQHSKYTKWLMRQMDRIITTSNPSASYLDLPHDIIPHGIDLNRFHPPVDGEADWRNSGLPGLYGVGCFGRVRHQKGTDLYVKALIELLPEFPDWTAVVFGRVTADNRGFAAKLHEEVDNAGLTDRIIFMGEVADVKPWYRRVSLCVAPSRNEGFGLTPLEAMASQTAVVASDAGAYRDLVSQGHTGEVVPADNFEALKAAIRTYLSDPQRTANHGRAGLARAQTHFALEKEAAALNEAYRQLWEAK